ncbi:MAG: serine/threonine-protein kinase [Acidobacteriota bacterium]
MRIPAGIEDKYDVLFPLGKGGMGEVFKVRHRLLDEARVIKVLRAAGAEDDSRETRFLHEARAAAELRHPHVAQIHDFAIDQEGAPYIVMEFIDGLTWRKLTDRLGALPVPLAVELACQALGALEYLHQRSFVHRDIAPDNLMVTRDVDGRLQVKLIDLGLAKRLTGDTGVTEAGWFAGKLRYASPEQFRSADTELDHRSDLYSFGVVLFEMLTGVCPIQGRSPEQIVGARVQGPPDVSQVEGWKDVPSALREVVLSALESEPEKRPQTAAELSRALEPFRTGDVPDLESLFPREDDVTLDLAAATATGALPPSGPAPAAEAGRPPTRRLWIAAAAALVVVLTLAWFQLPRSGGGASLPTGKALIDAAPWAEVTRVVNARGETVTLSSPAVTPLILDLPPGGYAVFLSHPQLEGERQVDVDVVADAVTDSLVELEVTDLDRYFERIGLDGFLRTAGSE